MPVDLKRVSNDNLHEYLHQCGVKDIPWSRDGKIALCKKLMAGDQPAVKLRHTGNWSHRYHHYSFK